MEWRTSSRQCPDEKLAGILAVLKNKTPNGMEDLHALIESYPMDARLYFLKGSLLAAGQDYNAARDTMRQAISFAPDLHIASFQLGLLCLTSGDIAAALEAWRALQSLPPDHYLRVFSNGLECLIRDDFAEAVHLLRKGIALNNENQDMNHDMQLIIDKTSARQERPDDAVSPIDFFLQQSALKPKR